MSVLKVGNCAGKIIFSIGRLRIELWKVPKGEKIPPHTHDHVISRFIFLDRNLKVHRAGSCKSSAVPFFRWYKVGAGAEHWAEAVSGDARFLNFEWWTGDGKPMSPAEDFHAR